MSLKILPNDLNWHCVDLKFYYKNSWKILVKIASTQFLKKNILNENQFNNRTYKRCFEN